MASKVASNDLGGREVTSMTHAKFSSSTNVILFNFCLKCYFDPFLNFDTRRTRRRRTTTTITTTTTTINSHWPAALQPVKINNNRGLLTCSQLPPLCLYDLFPWATTNAIPLTFYIFEKKCMLLLPPLYRMQFRRRTRQSSYVLALTRT